MLETITACAAEARVWTNYVTELLRVGNVIVPKYLVLIKVPEQDPLFSVSSAVHTLSKHYWSSFVPDVHVM